MHQTGVDFSVPNQERHMIPFLYVIIEIQKVSLYCVFKLRVQKRVVFHIKLTLSALRRIQQQIRNTFSVDRDRRRKCAMLLQSARHRSIRNQPVIDLVIRPRGGLNREAASTRFARRRRDIVLCASAGAITRHFRRIRRLNSKTSRLGDSRLRRSRREIAASDSARLEVALIFLG